jgi:glucose-6-phosphate 1-epimerase
MNDATTAISSASGGSTIHFTRGHGGLPRLDVRTPWSEAQIYLHGAHITHFQRAGEPPLLFLSRESWFADGQPIRGGIPVILPWFGAREGQPRHGFARLHAWELRQVCCEPDGRLRLTLRLPECAEATAWPRFEAEFAVTAGEQLELELSVRNTDPTRALELADCLHTYFAVGNIAAVEVRGLKGVTYLDSLDGHARKVEAAEGIRFAGEVDRLYVDTPHAVDILDAEWRRRIRVEKAGARSTVVWNPWIAKSRQMPDFGDEEYRSMVCVESGNCGPDQLALPPGGSVSLRVRLSSQPL